jgi:bifunctional DNA-binding transcriptional regulator/antitoxin component of YhaV-PrlF toxin-antitoxin module
MQLQTTRLSSKGHAIIPKTILDAYHLNSGQEFEIEATAQGILLKAKNKPVKTPLNDLIGCTGYQGKTKTLEEMDEGIRQGIPAKWGKHDTDKFASFDKKFRNKATALNTGITLVEP